MKLPSGLSGATDPAATSTWAGQKSVGVAEAGRGRPGRLSWGINPGLPVVGLGFCVATGGLLPDTLTAKLVCVARAGWLRRLLFLPLSALAFWAGSMLIVLPAVRARHQAEEEQFQAAAAWLQQTAAPGDVVMTTQPYTLHYASGHPCIAVPASESPDAAWDAARRFGARWLVITQSFGHYPQVLHDRPGPRFRLAGRDTTAEFYEILGETGD